MTATTLVPTGEITSSSALLVPAGAGKDERHRLGRFAAWLDGMGRPWFRPDLAAYRDWLLARGLAASSVAAHLSTIRGRYGALLREGGSRDRLYALTPVDAPLDQRKAAVDELVRRLEDAIHPKSAPVKVIVRQDRPDAEQIRLSAAQASALMAAPGVDTLVGLRDTSVIALMLCTGVREAELCALDVADLRGRLGGALSLHIRRGKSLKERLIPYGELEWVLAILDHWLRAVEITGGAVFRGVYKGGERLRPGRLSVRAVQQNILAQYPIMVDGEMVRVKPHDLRRTYARRLYEAGVDLVAIQQNLGHANSKTTLGYVGVLDADTRKPPSVYLFDLSSLETM